jgi:hypothetical protein
VALLERTTGVDAGDRVKIGLAIARALADAAAR